MRVLPPAVLAPWVHHLWFVRWTLTTPRRAEALPYPAAQVVFEELDGVQRSEISGPRTERLTRTLTGQGTVFGITFRPGAFAPLFKGVMKRLTNRVVPLRTVFGDRSAEWAEATFAAPEPEQRIALASAFLEKVIPALPIEVRRVRDLVERMATDRSLVRVEDVCHASGRDLRTLQRDFRRFVGVSPKWVIQRFRLIEAVEQLKAPDRPSLGALAAALGYADQSHFARDFKRVVGETPRNFIERRCLVVPES